jgi:predicted outer membrane repeat protein
MWGIGCGVACTEPKVEAPGLLVLSAEELLFTDVPLGAAGRQSLRAGNDGAGPLELRSVSVSEGSSRLWTVEDDGAGVLAPGDVVEITIRYTPADFAEALGAIQLRTDAPDQESVEVRLRGTTALSNDDMDADGFSPAEGDCDDGDRLRYPGAEEVCDGRDNDCDGVVPLDEANADGDPFRICEGDCDDDNGRAYPGYIEFCDGADADNDCDAATQDNGDMDIDGVTMCGGDCDDADPLRVPDPTGANEVCDGVDNDCNGAIDDVDRDGDGRGLCDRGGDCDDRDPSAYGVFVATWGDIDTADGSPLDPYPTLFDALNGLDEVCRTIYVDVGEYELVRSWDDGFLRIVGLGESADQVSLRPPVGTDYRVLAVQQGSVLELENLFFLGADAGVDGGVVSVESGELRATGVVFYENHSWGQGGAVHLRSAAAAATFTDCAFTGNSAEGDGGAVRAVDGAQVAFLGGSLSSNVGRNGGGLALGTGAAATLDAVDFDRNAADDAGGAILAENAALTAVGGRWERNAAGGSGGGLRARGSAVDLRNLVLADNVAGGRGGGVALGGAGSSGLLANLTLAGNVAALEGGGVSLAGPVAAGGLVVVGGDGAGLVHTEAGSGAEVGWTTAFGARAGAVWLLGDGTDAGDNTTEDPLLVRFTDDGTPTGDDLRPAAGSPLIDSGPPADSLGRRVWADGDGSANDRGHTGGPDAAP